MIKNNRLNMVDDLVSIIKGVVEKSHRVTQKTIAPVTQIDVQMAVIVYKTPLKNVEISTSCKRDR